ncbi:hypothetical protein CDCA_CDCA01G0272 [Cyanidium caldarium]|uniref:Probable ATP-dependent transporter ycf16 n=1 Tax=Cyanidium caldarium TaxID=2771 RepID=A0AAV9IPR8_CYACA|nr:hypothetical protein CDCA_CDCA01G0272 [Cyanidium caldarium]
MSARAKKVKPKKNVKQQTDTVASGNGDDGDVLEVLPGFEDLLLPSKAGKKGKKGKKSALSPDLKVRVSAPPPSTSSTTDAVSADTAKSAASGEDERVTAAAAAVVDGQEPPRPSAKSLKEVQRKADTIRERVKATKSAAAAGRGALDLGGGDAARDAPAFVSVRLDQVSVTYKNEDVLHDASLEVKSGDRIAVVGKNGTGKTTLLRIMGGLQEATTGEVVRTPPNLRVAFLRQEFNEDLNASNTLREELQSALAEENRCLQWYQRVETELGSAGDDLKLLDRLLEELEQARVACESCGAFHLDAKLDRMMAALGFTSPDDPEKLVLSYSGGWKMRIGLGKVLLQSPQVLLLDEPSNHLDVDSVEWLEGYLRSQDIPMVIVSHDREFIDRVCNKVVEIERGETVEYLGNYTEFLRLKGERLEAWRVAYEKQEKYLEEQRAFINRFRGNAARAAQVKSREQQLDKFRASPEFVRRPPGPEKGLRFRFPPAPRSAREVVHLEHVSKTYGDRTLFRDVSLTVERGDRIAVVGPNGSGKSTLLRIICGLEPPTEGTVTLSEHGTHTAYFEQNQADALDLELTVLDTIREHAPPRMRYEEIRALLGRFLFKGDAVGKKVSALSGGEKARLALCKILLKPANLLVLDEPGNHVDIGGREMLEEALQEYDGTLILVSHDRYFVSRVATQILAIEDGEVVAYNGDYRHYCEQHEELRQRLQERAITGVTEIQSAPVRTVVEVVEEKPANQKRKRTFGGSSIKTNKNEGIDFRRWVR